MSHITQLFAVLVLCLFATSAFAAVMHARSVHPGYERLSRADPRKVIKFRLALVQKNLDVLESRILDAANPDSENYGKWLKTNEILDLIAPDTQITQSIAKWLLAHGATHVDISGRDIISARASVSNIERIFKTEMHNFRHAESGKIQTRHFGAIIIPDEFAEHIDLVTGITELWGPSHVRLNRRPISNKERNDVSSGYVIPENIRALYNIPATSAVNQKSSICVAEFQDDSSYADSDNTYFNQQMLENVKVSKKVGPYNPSQPDGESTLDVQYGFSLALNATTWFWTVEGWMMEFATDLFNANSRPLVVSMSWGWPEPRQCQIDQCSNSEDYVKRVNTEFMKITGTGVTLLAASGDQGAPGDSNPYCSSSSTPISTIFPGASPWVVSVGATMLSGSVGTNVYKAPVCKNYPCGTTKTEAVCTYPAALITTGGGFSDYIARPSWQDTAVTGYLNSGVQLPPSNYFEKGNRGFPDVSGLGHAYLIAISQELEQVDGTSASSPLWGAIISLLNDVRLDQGKSPLGFVNPVLYAAAVKAPSAYHDITTGNNKCTESCCATIGYLAASGWDAVTGLGSPNFAVLQTYVKTLQ